MTSGWLNESMFMSFDGAVFEIFGTSEAPSVRFHVQNLRMQVDDPNRKGQRLVWLQASKIRSAVCITVDAEHWTVAEPVLTEVMSALAAGIGSA